MANLVLTRPLSGGGSGTLNIFETIITDSGSIIASGNNDTLTIIGGTAITTSVIGSPNQLLLTVDPSEINLSDLGDVYFTGSPEVSDGYTLVFRTGSPEGWVAEPSTTTDEFVKVSGTDTTTGHLSDKIIAGTGLLSSVFSGSPGGDEQLELFLNASIDDLTDVVTGSPITTGYVLGFNGTNWVPVDPADSSISITQGPGISITSVGSPQTSQISLDICSVTAAGSPNSLSIDDVIAACDGSSTFAYSLAELAVVLSSVINLGDLGDVFFLNSPQLSDGDVLIYRTGGSPSGWINEPSTVTDEFVKVSATDTSTGHLDDKLLAGTHIVKILNSGSPGGDETLELAVDPSTIDHGSLSGLTDDDHPQYTTNAYDGITDGTNSASASGRDNTVEFVAGDGVDITVAEGSGSPLSNDTVTISTEGNLELSIINGQPTLTFLDTTRLTGSPSVGKRLSIAEQTLVFSENQVNNLDWVEIGNVVDADSGYMMDFDGTVTFATGHCENTGAASKNFHLFVNGIDQGSIGTLSGGGNAQFINTTIDVDFDQGDKIRLQAQNGAGGTIQDTIVKITVKWRK